ncbi:MAG: hypothetical protein QOG14_4880 [Mycobacterium sp.]|nr:hypothetical protein [Mycobacterium sp.]
MVSDGEHFAFVHTPTVRARETAELVCTALLAMAARHGSTLIDAGLITEPGYRMWADSGPTEPTQARA